MKQLHAAELELALKVTREELASWPTSPTPTLEEYLHQTAQAFESAGLKKEAAQIRRRRALLGGI